MVPGVDRVLRTLQPEEQEVIRAIGFAEVTVGIPMLIWGGLTHNPFFLVGGIGTALCGAYAVHRNRLEARKD